METNIKFKDDEKPVDGKIEGNIYLLIGKDRYLFKEQVSPIFGVKEYFVKAKLLHNEDIKLVREDKKELPVHNSANCGYTLVGKAITYFHPNKSLCASGDSTDANLYVYINEHSTLTYVGQDEEHTLFVRIYDNINGINNDRWVVLYID